MANRPCLGVPEMGLRCGEVSPRTRCGYHSRVWEKWRRGTTTQRGYGAQHRQARGVLGGTLPSPCGYCRVTVLPGERWVAAHVRDGQPEYGWMVAHPGCNERAKQPGGWSKVQDC